MGFGLVLLNRVDVEGGGRIQTAIDDVKHLVKGSHHSLARWSSLTLYPIPSSVDGLLLSCFSLMIEFSVLRTPYSVCHSALAYLTQLPTRILYTLQPLRHVQRHNALYCSGVAGNFMLPRHEATQVQG